jgi:hypothetical protein
MSNHEHRSESDPGQPDQLWRVSRFLTVAVANLIATGEFDPTTITTTDYASALPPGLREMIQKWVQEQMQTNNDTPPPDIPPSPETPQ